MAVATAAAREARAAVRESKKTTDNKIICHHSPSDVPNLVPCFLLYVFSSLGERRLPIYVYNMERVVQLFVKGPSFPFVVQLCFVPVDRIMCKRGAVTYLCTLGRSAIAPYYEY